MVFTDKFDAARHPLPSRLWGVFLGTIVMCCAAGATFSMRTLPAPLLVLLLAGGVATFARGRRWRNVFTFDSVALFVIAFLVAATVSALWAREPLLAVYAIAYAAFAAVATRFLVHLFVAEESPGTFHIAEGAWIGFLAGLVYLAIEILTDQSIKIWLYNALQLTPNDVSPAANFKWDANGRLTSIARNDLTRNLVSLPALSWPCLLAMRATLSQRAFPIAGGIMMSLVAFIVFNSNHETSMVALIASAAVFGLAYVHRRLTFSAVTVTWIAACILIVPIALLMYRIGLQDSPHLPQSAQHRVIIWNYSAENALDAPLLGHGVDTMRAYCAENPENKCITKMRDPIISHPHNGFLQVWYELGAFGVTIFAMLGVAIIAAIQRLPRTLSIYGLATFVACTTALSASTSLWSWGQLAVFSFATIVFAIAVRAGLKFQPLPRA